MSSCVSLNLTNGPLVTHLDDATVNGYSAPLFITGIYVVMEIVFWSVPYQSWIVLVRDHTARLFPPGCGMLEYTEAEIQALDAQLRAR